jgi:hypothetical protein
VSEAVVSEKNCELLRNNDVIKEDCRDVCYFQNIRYFRPVIGFLASPDVLRKGSVTKTAEGEHFVLFHADKGYF